MSSESHNGSYFGEPVFFEKSKATISFPRKRKKNFSNETQSVLFPGEETNNCSKEPQRVFPPEEFKETFLFSVKEKKYYSNETQRAYLNSDGSYSEITPEGYVYLSPSEVKQLKYPDREFSLDKDENYQSFRDMRRDFFNLSGEAYDLELKKRELKGLEFVKDRKIIDERIKEILLSQKDFTDEQLEKLLKDCSEWLKRRFYLVIQEVLSKEVFFRELPKRGNQKYVKILKGKIYSKLKFMEKKEFEANYLPRRTSKGWVTNVIFITATSSHKHYNNSRKESWLREAEEYNLFLANLRKVYGKIEYIDTIESTKEGYIHNHMLLILEKPVLIFKDKKNKFRMSLKRNLEKYCHMGFTDVFAPEKPKDVLNYLLKGYMFKTYSKKSSEMTRQDLMTIALPWIFRKQAYRMSGFRKETSFLKDLLSQDSNDLIVESIIQTDDDYYISEFADGNYICLGITSLKWKEGYDPPDKFSRYLTEHEIESILLISVNKPILPKILKTPRFPPKQDFETLECEIIKI